MRYGVELKKIKFVLTRRHVIFCLLYKHTNDDVFDDFPKITDHFLKISKDFPIVLKARLRLPNIFPTFPKTGLLKIAEDC